MEVLDPLAQVPPKALRQLLIPAKLAGLFKPFRYKIAYGGRGSGKSWSFARALLILATKQRLRIVCFREIQNSIEESVHALLKQQIEEMGLGKMWEVQAAKIKCHKTRSEIVFAGLSTLTAQKIKSYEGFDIAWVEEAESVTADSWSKLIPTIRKDDVFGPGNHAEIWITLNPQLDTDPTYKEFIESPPPGALVVGMNYTDNPWFPKVLEIERIRAKAKMTSDEYNNVWRGMTRAAVSGAIYAEAIAELRADGRYAICPRDPKLPVHLVLDLGWNDSMFVCFVQKRLGVVCIIEAMEVDHCTLEDLNRDIREGRNWKWGSMWLPHDGEHGNYHTGMSAMATMRKTHGWTVRGVPKVSIEEGIKIARGMLAMTVIDQRHAQDLMHSLRRYRRDINKHGEGTRPTHDDASHGADCYRYVALCAPLMKNDDLPPERAHNRAVSYPVDEEMGM